MSEPVTIRTAGDQALLVEIDGNQAVHALAVAARDAWGDGLEEVVPGHSTLLLVWRSEPPGDAARRLRRMTSLTLESSVRDGPLVTVPVRYDGPDLEAVAAAAGIAPEEVPAIHSGATYTAGFIGFAPGFAYLVGGDERLTIPRRERPRVRVPAGSVAVAAGYSAVYPSAGPGGWHIIGHTELRLFDPAQDRVPLIEPGALVRFEAL